MLLTNCKNLLKESLALGKGRFRKRAEKRSEISGEDARMPQAEISSSVPPAATAVTAVARLFAAVAEELMFPLLGKPWRPAARAAILPSGSIPLPARGGAHERSHAHPVRNRPGRCTRRRTAFAAGLRRAAPVSGPKARSGEAGADARG